MTGISFFPILLLTPPPTVWCFVQSFVLSSHQSRRRNVIRKVKIWNEGNIIQQSQVKQLRRLSSAAKKPKCPYFLTIIDDAQEKQDTRIIISKFKDFTEMFERVLNAIEARKEFQKQLKEDLTKFEWNVKCLTKVKDMLGELELITANANKVQARIYSKSKLYSTILTLQPFIEEELVPMKVKLLELEIDIRSEQKRWDADEKDKKKRIAELTYRTKVLDGEIEIITTGINTIQTMVTISDAEIGKTKQNVQMQVDQWMAKRKELGNEFRVLQYQMQFINDKKLGDGEEDDETEEEEQEDAKNELLQFADRLETMEKIITEGDEKMEKIIEDTKSTFNVKDKELAQARQAIKDELCNFSQENEKAFLLKDDVEIQLEGRMKKSTFEIAELHRNLSVTIAEKELGMDKKKAYKEKAFNHFMEIKSIRQKKNVARLQKDESLRNQTPKNPQQQRRQTQAHSHDQQLRQPQTHSHDQQRSQPQNQTQNQTQKKHTQQSKTEEVKSYAAKSQEKDEEKIEDSRHSLSFDSFGLLPDY